MRRTVSGVALVMAGVLLAGCGVGSGGGDDKPASAAKSKKKPGPPETHEVTLEVQGTGSSQIGWAAGSSHFGTATLPWKKTTEVTLEGAQLKTGVQLYVTPQAVKGANGKFVFPPCVLKVDGKKVDENAGGKSSQGCKYHLKGS
ncbi:hypothetical protein ITI46_13575 [Streptomyces oryzae]|uniref:Lipoprotein n=1 Tax=Streptomyces oryzae TaxID=1434886 RepID=A0ABS3XBD6_9ACTN|nr:hypothetical protein [Streptomyces oryzae]MBO8192688.1 hypothetical protein [Streptomyces oryzae]